MENDWAGSVITKLLDTRPTLDKMTLTECYYAHALLVLNLCHVVTLMQQRGEYTESEAFERISRVVRQLTNMNYTEFLDFQLNYEKALNAL